MLKSACYLIIYQHNTIFKHTTIIIVLILLYNLHIIFIYEFLFFESQYNFECIKMLLTLFLNKC